MYGKDKITNFHFKSKKNHHIISSFCEKRSDLTLIFGLVSPNSDLTYCDFKNQFVLTSHRSARDVTLKNADEKKYHSFRNLHP